MADELASPDTLQAAQPARPSLLGILFSVESGGKNIANTTQGTTSGQAQGYFQITTGTWNEFAPQAGIDTEQYPTPMSAPYIVQAQIASKIPLSRWDPKTINAIRVHYPQINTSLPLGQNVAATGGNFLMNAPGNTHDGQFRIAKGEGGYQSDGSVLPPQPPRNFLDTVGDAVTQTAEKKAEAAPAVAAAEQKPLLGQQGPLGLSPQQPTPMQVPRTMDYYLALLKQQPAPGSANG